MSLQEEVIRILSERATHRINFNYGRARIDPAAFLNVQHALRDGVVTVDIDPSLTSRARYDRNTHTMHLWQNANASSIRGNAASKGLIVHEAVHVFTHLRCGSRLAHVDDELVAFLAQTIYRLAIQGYAYRGSRQRGGSFSSEIDEHRTSTGGRIFGLARQIVIDHQMLDQEGCTPLIERDVAELRRALIPYCGTSAAAAG